MAEEVKNRPRLNDLPAEEVDMVLGAWVAGMGFVLLLIGLSVWVRSTCDDDHCLSPDTPEEQE